MAQGDLRTLVSTDWLASHLNDPDLRIVDASWYLPAMNRDGHHEYLAEHIPGAVFFDIDDVSDQHSTLPHMVPPVDRFISQMRDIGIGDGNRIVVYDGAGIFSAARVWWLFRLMGKPDIAVLDGGLPKWRAEGRSMQHTVPAPRNHPLAVDWQGRHVRDVTEVATASGLGSHEIIDARSAGRFRGDEPEPRAGLRSGRIPGSKNVYFQDLLNSDATMKPTKDLRAIFSMAGVDLDKPVITSCGSGVTAAILNLGLECIGHENHSLYDGSWSEWGMESGLRVETGGL